MDRITKEQRSRNMSAIRGKGNKTTEIELVGILRKEKISGWRRHKKGAYGSPDFLFRSRRVVLLVDGCFWHGCKHHCIMPKSNMEYWSKKIERNKKHDREVNLYYRNKGWAVSRIWEHEIKDSGKVLKKIRKILNLYA